MMNGSSISSAAAAPGAIASSAPAPDAARSRSAAAERPRLMIDRISSAGRTSGLNTGEDIVGMVNVRFSAEGKIRSRSSRTGSDVQTNQAPSATLPASIR